MTRCPYCQYENRDAAIYCERCETLLQKAALAQLVKQLSANNAQVEQNEVYEGEYTPVYTTYDTPVIPEFTTSLLHETETHYRVERYDTDEHPTRPKQSTSVTFFRTLFLFVVALPMVWVGSNLVLFTPMNPSEHEPFLGSVSVLMGMMVYVGGGVVWYHRRERRRPVTLGGFLMAIFCAFFLTLIFGLLVMLATPILPRIAQEILVSLVILVGGMSFSWVALY